MFPFILIRFNPIFGQYFHFISPKSTRKQKVFRCFQGYKMGIFARNGLKFCSIVLQNTFLISKKQIGKDTFVVKFINVSVIYANNSGLHVNS